MTGFERSRASTRIRASACVHYAWVLLAATAQATSMDTRTINAPDAPAAAGGYSQAVEISSPRRMLYISGQIPVDRAGDVPADFAAQCKLVWANIGAQLRAAGMSLDNLVKVTTFLSDRSYAAENSRIRRVVLGERAPALTIVITGIYDSSWLLEIEAIAAE
jgi:2-iminobutanoate/2-iminopropanoate deaminase